MTTDTQTLESFLEKYKISARAREVASNPHMADMPAGSHHYRVKLSKGERGVSYAELTVPFSQGPAIEREPSAADVLDCLASDSAGYENEGSFEGWCADYGYDTDSRKAERTFNAVKKQAIALRNFLGTEAYASLLWDTERL